MSRRRPEQGISLRGSAVPVNAAAIDHATAREEIFKNRSNAAAQAGLPGSHGSW